jgi:hypothetical protein
LSSAGVVYRRDSAVLFARKGTGDGVYDCDRRADLQSIRKSLVLLLLPLLRERIGKSNCFGSVKVQIL